MSSVPLSASSAPAATPRPQARHAWLPALLLAAAGSLALLHLPAAQAAPAEGAPPHAQLPRPEHAERMVDRLLMGVDNVTAQQRSQLLSIGREALRDLAGQREAGHKLRERQRQLLVQPTVDAAALEQLRQQMLAQHDQMSRRRTQALLDASRVLSAEQRTQIARRMEARAERMHDRPRGPGRGEGPRPERHGRAGDLAAPLL